MGPDVEKYVDAEQPHKSEASELTGVLCTPAKQQRMVSAVKYLTEYMQTYNEQRGYENYADRVLIDDVLYGLGVALYPEDGRYAQGYEMFKKKLREHLGA